MKDGVWRVRRYIRAMRMDRLRERQRIIRICICAGRGANCRGNVGEMMAGERGMEEEGEGEEEEEEEVKALIELG